jgi:hypothetical protein
VFARSSCHPALVLPPDGRTDRISSAEARPFATEGGLEDVGHSRIYLFN